MKVFNAIATAALIGASFITANPVEARNGWIYATTTRDGTTYYVKPLGCSGNLCSAIERANTEDLKMVSDCSNAWRYKYSNGSDKWIEVMPSSIGETIQKIVCSQ